MCKMNIAEINSVILALLRGPEGYSWEGLHEKTWAEIDAKKAKQ